MKCPGLIHRNNRTVLHCLTSTRLMFVCEQSVESFLQRPLSPPGSPVQVKTPVSPPGPQTFSVYLSGMEVWKKNKKENFNVYGRLFYVHNVIIMFRVQKWLIID